MPAESETRADKEGGRFIVLPLGEIILYTAYRSHRAQKHNILSRVLDWVYDLSDFAKIIILIASLGIAFTLGNILILLAVLFLVILLKIFFRITNTYLKKDFIESFGIILGIDQYRPRRYVLTSARILKTALCVDNRNGCRAVKTYQLPYGEIKDVRVFRAADYPDGVGDLYIEAKGENFKPLKLEYVEDAENVRKLLLEKTQEPEGEVPPLGVYNGWPDRKSVLNGLFPGDEAAPLRAGFLKKNIVLGSALLLFLTAEALKDYNPNAASALFLISGAAMIAILVEDVKTETVVTDKRVFRIDRQRRIIESLPYDMMQGVHKTGKRNLAIDVKDLEKTQFKIENLQDTDKVVEYINDRIVGKKSGQ